MNGSQFKENYTGPIFLRRVFAHMNGVSRFLNNIRGVGGGDSFASGLIYGFLSGLDPQTCVEYGAAHGALAMTTPGDTSTATLAEVKSLAAGGSARVQR